MNLITDLTAALKAVEQADNPDDLYDAHEALYAVASEVLADLTKEAPVERDLGNWSREALDVRRAANECAIANDWCLVHDVEAGFGHYLDTQPREDRGHNPATGIAYND